MALTAPPTILLIPGAFTDSSCYDLMTPYSQRAGFPVVAASLVSSNPDNPDEYTAASEGQWLLDKYLLPLVNEGKRRGGLCSLFRRHLSQRSGSKLFKATAD